MSKPKPLTVDEAILKGYHFNQPGTHEEYICMKREQFREILEGVWEEGVETGKETGYGLGYNDCMEENY